MKTVMYLLLFNFQIAHCQNSKDSIQVIRNMFFGTNYKDFVVIEKNVFAITNGDSLVTWNLDTKYFQFIKKDIATIVKTSKNDLIVGTKNGLILKKNEDIYDKILNIRTRFYKLYIDKDDNVLTISNKGIHHKNRRNYPFNTKVLYSKYYNDESITSFEIPDFAYIDHNNLLWLNYDKGEFGETTLFFDTHTRKFFDEPYLSLDLKFDDALYDEKLYKAFPDKIKKIDNQYLFKFPNNLPIYNAVKGICQDEANNYYFSESLMHFFLHGSIYKYSNIGEDFYEITDFENVLEYDEHIGNFNGTELKSRDLQEYIGPINYNRAESCVYFYSSSGFFKIKEEMNDKHSKELVFKPKILWVSGLRQSVGYQMNVIKFDFVDDKNVIFLTTVNGIGYFNGEKIEYFQ